MRTLIPDRMRDEVSRRSALRKLAAVAAAAGTTPAREALGATQTHPIPAATQPQGACVLFPQAVEGPYYFDPKFVRSDITEGRPGLPLALELRVIEHGPCTPIAGTRVDVWHADAGGIYSGYDRQGDAHDVSAKGQTHLRGTQVADADGRVAFQSIYPGWYPGRTPHIHVKVFLDDRTLVTGQIYFPEELSARIYFAHAPYNSRPVSDTINANDWLFRRGSREGGGIVFAATEASDRVAAALLIAVDRTGAAVKKSIGWRSWLRW